MILPLLCSPSTTASGARSGGTLSSEELGRSSGKLTYVFDIRIPGKKGLEIVSVLASDGTVVSMTHKSEWAARRDAQTKRRLAANHN